MEPLLKWNISTLYALVVTSLDQLLLTMPTIIYFFIKTKYLDEEVKRTEPSLSVSVPCPIRRWCILSEPRASKKIWLRHSALGRLINTTCRLLAILTIKTLIYLPHEGHLSYLLCHSSN